jgi:hypothetical protein
MGRRGRVLLALSMAAAGIAAPRIAHAECRPIHVIITGSVTSKDDGRPIPDLPVTLRIQGENGGLPSVEWDAVVTNRHGRFEWLRDYPADPCRRGNLLLHLPSRLGGKLRHPRSRAYRFGAMKIPQEIVLDTTGVIRPVRRDELLQVFDPKTRTAKVEVDFTP